MARNDNSVNITPATRSYHHGDLRAALIAAGLEMLKDRSADALSLREIARQVGVSATAVYRHFPDKQALLYALCEDGADQLRRCQQAAMDAAGGGKAGFDATGRAYVRFALEHPALFRLMSTIKRPGEADAVGASAVNGAMQLLRQNVASLLPAEASDMDKRLATIKAWAKVHGLAMLMLDGQVAVDDRLIDAITTPVMPGPVIPGD